MLDDFLFGVLLGIVVGIPIYLGAALYLLLKHTLGL